VFRAVVGDDANLLSALRADPGQHVGPEEADREDDQHERHNEVDEGNEHLTQLEGDATHRDSEGTDALAGGCSRGEEGREDVLRQRLEKLSNDTSEVERRSEDDDVPCIKHFYYDGYTLFRKDNGY